MFFSVHSFFYQKRIGFNYPNQVPHFQKMSKLRPHPHPHPPFFDLKMTIFWNYLDLVMRSKPGGPVHMGGGSGTLEQHRKRACITDHFAYNANTTSSCRVSTQTTKFCLTTQGGTSLFACALLHDCMFMPKGPPLRKTNGIFVAYRIVHWYMSYPCGVHSLYTGVHRVNNRSWTSWEAKTKGFSPISVSFDTFCRTKSGIEH